jgi:hypothetical protein
MKSSNACIDVIVSSMSLYLLIEALILEKHLSTKVTKVAKNTK